MEDVVVMPDARHLEITQNAGGEVDLALEPHLVGACAKGCAYAGEFSYRYTCASSRRGDVQPDDFGDLTAAPSICVKRSLCPRNDLAALSFLSSLLWPSRSHQAFVSVSSGTGRSLSSASFSSMDFFVMRHLSSRIY